MNAEEIWWKQIPVGLRIWKQLNDAMISHRGLWLSKDTPYLPELRTMSRDALFDMDSSSFFLHLDAPDTHEPPEVISLRQFGGGTVNPSAALKKLASQRGLLWVSHIPEAAERAWKCMAEQLAQAPHTLTLVLEMDSDGAKRKNITSIEYRDGLSLFDLQLYAQILATTERRISSENIAYAAQLSAILCEGDASVCEQLILMGMTLPEEPERVALDRGFTQDVATALVRRAQLAAIYPSIEMQRLNFIDRVEERAQKLLPLKDDYGQHIEQLSQLELRHLAYAWRQGELHLTGDEPETLQFLLDIRNEISHLHLLSWAQVSKVLAMDVSDARQWM